MATMLNAQSTLVGKATSKPFVARSSRKVVCAAAPKVNAPASQGPSDFAKKALSAIVAAQLAVLPVAGLVHADILPDTAESQSARDKVNAQTSGLPSFKDIGASLSSKLNVGGAKDVGREIANNTPDAPDLTQNPKDLAKDVGNKVQQATPDLSFSFGDNPADKAKDAASDIGDKAKDAADTAASKAQQTADSAKNAGDKAQNALPDTAELSVSQIDFPNPSELASKAQGAADKAGGNIPDPSNLGNKAQSLAGDAKSAAKDAAPGGFSLPSIPNPFGGNVEEDIGNKPI